MALAWHPYLDPGLVEHDLGGPLVRDRIGHRVHVALALLWCFSLGWPTSVGEIAAIPLVVFSALRTPNIWRTWGSLVVQPVFLGIVAFAVWQMVTLAWSPDRHQGWKEISANRWLAAIWALWPVMMHRGLLLRAVVAGFLCGNLVQLAQMAVGGAAWFPWHRMPGRISGWWDPVVGGSMLCGVLGVHMAAAAFGNGRTRALGFVGTAVTGAGIVATGTRGAWVAAAGLVVVSAVWWLGRRVSRRGSESAEKRSGLWMAAGAGLVVACIGAVLLGLRGPLADRVRRAQAETAGAVQRHEYRTDTGARVLMAYWAGRAVLEHPVGGVGAGGYHDWVVQRMREEGDTDPDPPIHAHPHDAALEVAATAGIVGLALAGFVMVAGLVGAARGNPVARAPGSERVGFRPFLGIVGLMLAGLFDPVHLNSQTGALLAVFLAMSLVSRPAERAVP